MTRSPIGPVLLSLGLLSAAGCTPPEPSDTQKLTEAIAARQATANALATAATPRPTQTPSPTATPTATPTRTITPTPSDTATPTDTATATGTSTPRPTRTAPPTATARPSPTPRPTSIARPTATARPTSTARPTAAPTATAQAASAGASVLRIGVVGGLVDADPAFLPGEADRVTAMTVGEGLVAARAGAGTWRPVLAQSFEPDREGRRIRFRLRSGVSFHGGYGEVTADDVKFSYERFLDEDLGAPASDDWAALDSVDVTGRYSGVIVLRRPHAPLWTETLPSVEGIILSRKAVEALGREAHARRPVGTGPYAIDRRGSAVVFRRFGDYWGDAPAWDEVRLRVLPDRMAAELALEAGDADVALVDGAAAARLADKGFSVRRPSGQGLGLAARPGLTLAARPDGPPVPSSVSPAP